MLRDNLHSIVIFKHRDMRVSPHSLHQSTLNLKPCIISVMKYAKVTMSSLTMKVVCSVMALIEVNTPVNERLNC